MKTSVKILIVAALAVTVVAAVALKQRASGEAKDTSPAVTESGVKAALPRLVDLGAGKCIPCKRMAPILEALRVDYAGAVNVQFIDVWKEPRAGKPYGIRLIPTQVFFDGAGRERFRHEGFFGRAEIEQIFKDSLGVALRPAAK